MGSNQFKARLLREGIAQSYIQLINDLMSHSFGQKPDINDLNYQKFNGILLRIERMNAILARIECSVDLIRYHAPTPMQEIRLIELRDKGFRIRKAIIESSEKMILSLSRRISKQVPSQLEKM